MDYSNLPTRLVKAGKTRWNTNFDMLTRLWILIPHMLAVISRLDKPPIEVAELSNGSARSARRSSR